MLRVVRVAALLCLVAGQVPAAGEVARGLSVIDGDTFDLNGERIRLLNIDAPEMGQSCRDGQGRAYRCGELSAHTLRRVLAAGAVRCTGRERDRYGRRLAHCRAGGRDVGALMVASGYALAFTRYSDEYLPQQIDARKAGRGLWAGRFDPPWEFRRSRWQQASGRAERADCPIKGNINGKGERIYHTPYSRHYDKTRVNAARGERWFCDEAEAVAAGWRPPRF